jgi:gas vesicle protein
MKSLYEFLNSQMAQAGANDVVIFEAHEIEQFTDVQQVYEALFDKMFIVEEGLFSKIGDALAKLGDKSKEMDAKIEDKKKKLSDAAKSAIETVKQKAGNMWDKVKDTYTNVVAQVDSALQSTKDTIASFADKMKVKASELEAKVATIVTNAMAKGGELGKKLMGFLADVVKAPALVAFFTSAVVAAKVGVEPAVLSQCIEMAVGKDSKETAEAGA